MKNKALTIAINRGIGSLLDDDNYSLITAEGVKSFIILYVKKELNPTKNDLRLLKESIKPIVYRDLLNEELNISIVFLDVLSKSNYSTLFERVDSYKSNISSFGYELIKTAMHTLENNIKTKI